MKIKFKEVKIETMIPEDYVEGLRQALNNINVCTIGNYDNCVTTTDIIGYWRPLRGSTPFSGNISELCREPEIKIEFRCKLGCAKSAVKTIKRIHPYEEPVINIIPLINI